MSRTYHEAYSSSKTMQRRTAFTVRMRHEEATRREGARAFKPASNVSIQASKAAPIPYDVYNVHLLSGHRTSKQLRHDIVAVTPDLAVATQELEKISIPFQHAFEQWLAALAEKAERHEAATGEKLPRSEHQVQVESLYDEVMDAVELLVPTVRKFCAYFLTSDEKRVLGMHSFKLQTEEEKNSSYQYGVPKSQTRPKKLENDYSMTLEATRNKSGSGSPERTGRSPVPSSTPASGVSSPRREAATPPLNSARSARSFRQRNNSDAQEAEGRGTPVSQRNASPTNATPGVTPIQTQPAEKSFERKSSEVVKPVAKASSSSAFKKPAEPKSDPQVPPPKTQNQSPGAATAPARPSTAEPPKSSQSSFRAASSGPQPAAETPHPSGVAQVKGKPQSPQGVPATGNSAATATSNKPTATAGPVPTSTDVSAAAQNATEAQRRTPTPSASSVKSNETNRSRVNAILQGLTITDSDSD